MLVRCISLLVVLAASAVVGQDPSPPPPSPLTVPLENQVDHARRASPVRSEALAQAATMLSAAEIMGDMLAGFQMSREQFSALKRLPHRPDSLQCVFYATPDLQPVCRFNPFHTTFPDFAAPQLPIEHMFKHVAHEDYNCRNHTNELLCGSDDRCKWHEVDGCVFGHDLHNKIADTLHHCMDSVYQRQARACFDGPSATKESCEAFPQCKLFGKGEGLDSPACLPKFVKDAKGALEAIKARRAAHAGGGASAGAGTTPASLAAAWPLKGFGTCHAAPLQHAAHTLCKHEDEVDCIQDPDCTLMKKTATGDYCVINGRALERLYFRDTKFMAQYLSASAQCKGVNTPDACHALNKHAAPLVQESKPSA